MRVRGVWRVGAWLLGAFLPLVAFCTDDASTVDAAQSFQTVLDARAPEFKKNRCDEFSQTTIHPPQSVVCQPPKAIDNSYLKSKLPVHHELAAKDDYVFASSIQYKALPAYKTKVTQYQNLLKEVCTEQKRVMSAPVPALNTATFEQVGALLKTYRERVEGYRTFVKRRQTEAQNATQDEGTRILKEFPGSRSIPPVRLKAFLEEFTQQWLKNKGQKFFDPWDDVLAKEDGEFEKFVASLTELEQHARACDQGAKSPMP